MPYAMLILASMFWGGNYVVGRLMVFHISPILLTELRWLLTAILLFMLYHKRVLNEWKQIKISFLSLFFLALCGQVLFPLNLYIGLQYTTPLNAAIYLSSTPALVLLINKLIFKDFVSKENIFGVLLSSLGVLYLILKGDINNFSQLSNLNKGDFWAIGSAVSWAVYCSFLRVKNKNITGNSFVTISSILGAGILIPAVLIVIFLDKTVMSTGSFSFPLAIGILYLVLFPSWLSYLFWSKGIAAIGATKGEVYTHLVPLFGGIFSILFLKNILYYYHMVSAGLIIIGIYLCSRNKKSVLQLKNVKAK